MAERQQALARVILQDPAVESLSSFIGVDGTNLTPNGGRLQINLKPRADRDADVSTVIRRLQSAVAPVAGITLYMQAVQDLAIEDRLSRTQYQYTLEHPTPPCLRSGRRVDGRLRSAPVVRDLASDSQIDGCARLLRSIATPRPVRHHRPDVDDALYNAFGQRQVSTIFTQSNQYHVVLEASPELQRDPSSLNESTSPPPTAPRCLLLDRASDARDEPLSVNHQGQFPATTLSFNLAPGAALGDAVVAVEDAASDIGLPTGVMAAFQGTAAAFRSSLANMPWLILAAIVTVYIVLGVLYESYVHPVTILSTLPSAGGGDPGAADVGSDLGVVALIGIILLIGIVKKNAIMMIDFALAAEGKKARARKRRSRRPASCASVDLMTTMAALLGGVRWR